MISPHSVIAKTTRMNFNRQQAYKDIKRNTK